MYYDILLDDVFPFVDVETGTSMMSTCRFLYHEGAKTVLRNDIHIYAERHLISFLLFLHAEDLSRLRYVRSLCFFTTLSPEVAESLADCVRNMMHLESLTLFFADSTLGSHSSLLSAFAGLTCLKEIHCYFAGKLTYTLLRTLQSKIVSASIYYVLGGEGALSNPVNDEDWLPYHPVVLLKQFALSLKELKGDFMRNMDAAFIPDAVYPNLRRLTISHTVLPIIAPYIHSFPNITHLTFRNWNRGMDKVSLAGMTSRYQRNLLDQDESGGWEHLQEFSGHVGDLYMSAIVCPRLVLRDDTHSRPRGALSAALTRARPTELEYNVYDTMSFFEAATELATVLRDEGGTGLEGLAIELMLCTNDRKADILRAMTDLESSLTGLRLRRLKLTVRDHRLDPTVWESVWEYDGADSTHITRRVLRRKLPLPPLEPAEVQLDAFDVETFAQRLAAGIPTLCDGLVSVDGARGTGRRVATISRDAGETAGGWVRYGVYGKEL